MILGEKLAYLPGPMKLTGAIPAIHSQRLYRQTRDSSAEDEHSFCLGGREGSLHEVAPGPSG
jgi:hypothetical protein